MDEIIKAQNTSTYPLHVGSAPITLENMEQWRRNVITPLLNNSAITIKREHQKYELSNEILEKLHKEEPTKSIEKIISLEEKNNRIIKRSLKQLMINSAMYQALLNAEVPHIPAMGSEYHVYKENSHTIISLIGPDEWVTEKKYLGTFVYNNLDFKIYKKK
jgi:hypothetical protein